MAVVMLLVPTVSAWGYRRGVEPYKATFQLRNPASTPYPGGNTLPTSTEFFGPQDPAWVKAENPDGYKYRLAKGLTAWGTIDAGPLGIGKMSLNQRYWLTNYETGIGYVLANYNLEFDGSYGDYLGTLTGTFVLKLKLEFPKFIIEGSGAFLGGTGDLKNIKIIANADIEIGIASLPYIMDGEFTGRIWGLS